MSSPPPACFTTQAADDVIRVSHLDHQATPGWAMWERATPVQTVVRYVAQPQTFASLAAVTFKARWTSEHSETDESAAQTNSTGNYLQAMMQRGRLE